MSQESKHNPSRPPNRPGLPAIQYRLGTQGEFLRRMLARLPYQEIPGGANEYGWGPTVVATIVSFVVGYAAIAWLLRWLAGHSIAIFVVYRVALGLLLFALLAADVIDAR